LFWTAEIRDGSEESEAVVSNITSERAIWPPLAANKKRTAMD
jgi:hypothetical protein